jgi:hypothetical protein
LNHLSANQQGGKPNQVEAKVVPEKMIFFDAERADEAFKARPIACL